MPPGDVVEVGQLVLGGQFAVDQQVRDLEEVGLLRKLLNRVSAVAQDACFAVDVGDRRLRAGGVHESGVVCDGTGGFQQRTDVEAIVALNGALDGELKLVVLVRQLRGSLLSHRFSFKLGQDSPNLSCSRPHAPMGYAVGGVLSKALCLRRQSGDDLVILIDLAHLGGPARELMSSKKSTLAR